MLTIKKSILSIAAVASSVILLSSCGSSEIVNPTIKEELGKAKVSGYFRVNTSELNDNSVSFTGVNVGTTVGNTVAPTAIVYENAFPAGKVLLYVTYAQSDVNPVPATPNTPAALLRKSMVVSVGTNGQYSFEVDAAGKGNRISVTAGRFVADYITKGAASNDGGGNPVAGTEPTITTSWEYSALSTLKVGTVAGTLWAVTDMQVFVGENVLPIGTFVNTTKQ